MQSMHLALRRLKRSPQLSQSIGWWVLVHYHLYHSAGGRPGCHDQRIGLDVLRTWVDVAGCGSAHPGVCVINRQAMQ